MQNLVKTITHDFVIRLAEPSSEFQPVDAASFPKLTLSLVALKAAVESEGLKLAADQLSLLTSVPEDPLLVARVAQKAKDRVDQKNEAYADLVSPTPCFREWGTDEAVRSFPNFSFSPRILRLTGATR